MRGQLGPDTADLRRLADHVSDRLRHLPDVRLREVEQDVRIEVQALAALALDVEGLPAQQAPALAARALGDQVAVLAADLADGLDRTPSAPMQQRAHEVLLRLRRRLP